MYYEALLTQLFFCFLQLPKGAIQLLAQVFQLLL